MIDGQQVVTPEKSARELMGESLLGAKPQTQEPAPVTENPAAGIPPSPPVTEQAKPSAEHQQSASAQPGAQGDEFVNEFSFDDDKQVQQQQEVKMPEGVEEFISQQFSVTGLNELKEKLSELPRLTEELKTLRESKPEVQFNDPAQKRLFEICSAYNGDNLSALADFERMQSMDLSKMSDEDVMREVYVMENKALGRLKAEKLFGIEFAENLDSSALRTDGLDPVEDADRIREIERLKEKRDLLREQKAIVARQKLSEQLKNNKLEPFKPAAQPQGPDMSRVKEAITKMVESAPKQLGDLEKVSVRFGKGDSDFFSVKLGKERSDQLKQAVANYYTSPSNYNEDGSLLVKATPVELANHLAKIMYGDELYQMAVNYGKQLKTQEINKQRQVQIPGQPIIHGREDSMDGMSDRRKLGAAILDTKK